MRRILRRHTRRGVTTVEMAMVAPLLIFLLFGIIEFGLMVKDLMGINQAAREGARTAATGTLPETVLARARSSAPSVNGDNLQITCEYRSFDPVTGGWSEWQPLGAQADGTNNADPGDQVRVRVSYPHQLVTGNLFAGLADDPENGTIMLSTSIVMQRQ